MAAKVQFSIGFATRLERVLATVERQRPGRGDKLSADVEDALELVANNPGIGTAAYGKYRRRIVLNSNYLLYYRLTGDTVLFLAVVHGAMAPGHIERILKKESAGPRSDIEPA